MKDFLRRHAPGTAVALAALLLALWLAGCTPAGLRRLPAPRSEPVNPPTRPVLHRGDRRALRRDRGLDRAGNPGLWRRVSLWQRVDTGANP